MNAETTPHALVPIPLATWLREREFDACAWCKAPVIARKVIGRDAWRFGKVVLVRIPLGILHSRYYIAFGRRSGTGKEQAVGYWLEVRQ